MASEKIIIPCRFEPSRNTNPNGDWAVWQMTTNSYNPSGVLLPNSLDTNVNFQTITRIPASVHATTPNGKLRVYYIPGAASGSIKLFDRIQVVEETVTSLDSNTYSPDSSATDTSSAANVLRHFDFSLTSIASSLVSGRHVTGVIQRKASSDGADTLEADALLFALELVLDDTA